MEKSLRFALYMVLLTSSCCSWFDRTLVVFASSKYAARKTANDGYACLQADRPIDIVLSLYEEDLEVVRSKLERLQKHPFVANRACVHVYAKSGKTLSLIDAARLNETVVVKTQNRGRESGAYLQYILSNYMNLPRHSIFLQADIEEIDKVLETLNQATEETGFLGLGIWGACNCDNCNLIHGKLVRIREIWALATGKFCLETFQANFRGQMLVSKNRIQRHRSKLYLMLLQSFFAPSKHPIHKDSKYLDSKLVREMLRNVTENEGGHDSLFGHVMERMWSVIFDCYGEEAHKGCKDADLPW